MRKPMPASDLERSKDRGQIGAEVPRGAPANLVVAWCRSRKPSADRASDSGVAHFSCRHPQVVAGDNLGALTAKLGCCESARG
jgi:hypothetical protein